MKKNNALGAVIAMIAVLLAFSAPRTSAIETILLEQQFRYLNITNTDPPPPPTGQRVTSIRVRNSTGRIAFWLRVRPAGAETWSGDLLEDAVSISSGETKTIFLAQPLNTATRYDFQLQQASGGLFIKRNILVTSSGTIEFTISDRETAQDPAGAASAGGTATSANVSSITVKNNTGGLAYWLRVRPSGAATWSGDLLANAVSIDDGETKTITLADPLDTSTRYDFQLQQASSGGGGFFIKRNILVTSSGIIEFTAGDRDTAQGSTGRSGGAASAGGTATPANVSAITVRNNTGGLAYWLRVRPSDTVAWSGDLLEDAVSIAAGETKTITLADPLNTATRYDFQLQQSSSGGGGFFIKRNIQVTSRGIIEFTAGDRETTVNVTSITVTNNTGGLAYWLRVRLSGTTAWSGDLLEDAVSIAAGETKTITLAYTLNTSAQYDFQLQQASSGGGGFFIKRNIQVTPGGIIEFTAGDRE